MEVDCTDSDHDDILASIKGDEDAYANLVVRYQAKVFNQMWRFTRDPNVLEELVQEVFIEVYRSLKSFKGKAPFLHWIRRIATRVGYRYWKHEARSRRLREEIERQSDWKRYSTENPEPSEAAEYLHNLLAQLPIKERLVLSLIYFEECNNREIAERTGWSEGLVRVRAHRARQRLKKLLENAGFGR